MTTNSSGVDMETLKNQILFGGAVIVTALAMLCLDIPTVMAIPLSAIGGSIVGFSMVYFRIKSNEPKNLSGEKS